MQLKYSSPLSLICSKTIIAPPLAKTNICTKPDFLKLASFKHQQVIFICPEETVNQFCAFKLTFNAAPVTPFGYHARWSHIISWRPLFCMNKWKRVFKCLLHEQKYTQECLHASAIQEVASQSDAVQGRDILRCIRAKENGQRWLIHNTSSILSFKKAWGWCL